MSIGLEAFVPPGARIKVVGVGGGGGNAVNTMIRSNLEGVEFVVANTDMQSLRFSLAPNKIQIGKELTRGLGAGADPDIGREAALEDRHEIQELLSGSDMVFITAGMGGGTGTGAAAVVAQIARELGALTVAVVTKPFGFEGKRRKKHADLGVGRLRECVDTLITIPNQRLLQVANPGLSMVDAFKMADAVLVNAVRGINDIINIPGIINVDFADVKTIMSCMGQALMGIGSARGENRAVEAARMAISSPLLEDIDIEGATGILINITAGNDLTLMEVNEACSIIQEAAHEDANIIFGSVIDEDLGDQINVTVIATGFPVDTSEEAGPEPVKSQQSPISSFTTRLTSPTIGASTKPAARAASQSLYTSTLTTRTAPAPRPAAAPTPSPAAPKDEKNENFDVAAPLASEATAAAQEPARLDGSSATPESAEPATELPSVAITAETAPLPVVDKGFDEARLLADWTMDGPSNNSASSELEDFPSLAHPSHGLSAQALPEAYGQPLYVSSAESDGPTVNEPEASDIEPVFDAPIQLPEEAAAPLPEIATEPMTTADTAQATRETLELEARLEGASLIDDPQDEFIRAGETEKLATLAESIFSDAGEEKPRLLGATVSDESPDSESAQSLAVQGKAAPLESFFDDHDAFIIGDIDRKIDEALQLAERMRSPKTEAPQDQQDELDVPAFLRQGMKDLPKA